MRHRAVAAEIAKKEKEFDALKVGDSYLCFVILGFGQDAGS